MSMCRPAQVLLWLLALTMVGCFKTEEMKNEDVGDLHLNSIPAESTGPFHARLLEIARTYETYGPVDKTIRITVVICDFEPRRFVTGITPAGSNPSKPDRFESDLDIPIRSTDFRPVEKNGVVHLSTSSDTRTHGKKMFFIFARDQFKNTYVDPSKKENSVGQVVVKEAWTPKEIEDNGKPLQKVTRRLPGKPSGNSGSKEEIEYRYVPYVRKEGKLFHAERKAGLFIMFKTDPATPGTDEGWVYGTVSADGKQVTSAGRLESCMKCHRGALHDRLFGFPED